ncbi:hypothetical protein [Planococcus antarcticus]|nr:hypothetical protein [Planococcus antarcticus]
MNNERKAWIGAAGVVVAQQKILMVKEKKRRVGVCRRERLKKVKQLNRHV